MNGFSNMKAAAAAQRDHGEALPSLECLGKMIDLLELSCSMPSSKLLVEEAPAHRNHPDARKWSARVQAGDKTAVSELSKCNSNIKLGGTPMKMHIEQELLKDEPKRKPSGVVAKLMGLESMPSHLISDRIPKEGYSHNSIERTSQVARFREGFPSGIKSCEQLQKPSRNNHVEVLLPHKGGTPENSEEKKMAMVRQKFTEAKRLVTNESFHSKEFQDVLEVLSSNRDLFLKLLEEPNSVLSESLNELRAIHLPSRTNRITVLKPSKPMNLNGEKQMVEKQCPAIEECNTYLPSGFTPKFEKSSPSTRIVVLRPKEVAEQMQGSFSDRRNDDSLRSSIMSNEYVGDESSVNRPENVHIEGNGGDFSDSDIASPAPLRSWDCMSRYGSPYSMPLLNQSSYLLESSLIREAKKQLLENRSINSPLEFSREPRQAICTSTLGDLLAEVKKERMNRRDPTVLSSQSCGGERDPSSFASLLYPVQAKGESSCENSPGNLLRSKSVPISSAYDDINIGVPESVISKPVNSKAAAAAKTRNNKSSIRERLSNVFFKRSKKSNSNKSTSSPVIGSEESFRSVADSIVADGVISKDIHELSAVGNPLFDSGENTDEPSSPPAPLEGGLKHGSVSIKSTSALEETSPAEVSGDNREQTSPVSVLEAPFEDDASSCSLESSRNLGSEALARSLSLDETSLKASSVHIPEHPLPLLSKVEEEQQEGFLFIRKLLSSAGLENETEASSVATPWRWHSPESPLDPVLLDDEASDLEQGGTERTKRMAHRRLLFDCMNSDLLEIGRSAICRSRLHRPHVTTCARLACSPPSLEDVLARIKAWSSYGMVAEADVDRVVWAEAAAGGGDWAEPAWWEVEEIGNNFGGKVLDELVEEALAVLGYAGACHET